MRLQRAPRPIADVIHLSPLKAGGLSWESSDRFGHPVRFDVEEFARGVQGVDARKAAFSGRPELIISLLPGIMDSVRGVATDVAERRFVALRHFFRFLDRHEERGGAVVTRAEQITSSLGVLFRAYLLEEPRRTNPMLLSLVFDMVQGARSHHGLPLISWPIIAQSSAPYVHRDVDTLAVSRLRAYALRRLRSVVPRHLANVIPVIGGTDHLNPSHVLGVVKEQTELAVIEGKPLSGERQQFFTRCFATRHCATRSTVSGGDEGIVSYRTVLVPSSDEIICAYTIVAADTGWLDAAKALSFDSVWFLPRETNPHTGLPVRGTIVTHRSKTGVIMRHTSTTGRNSVYGVLSHLEKRSAWLRSLLRQKNPASKTLIAKNNRCIASPFLYWANFGSKSSNRVFCLNSAWVLFDHMKATLLSTSSAALWSNEERDAVNALRVSDLRDGFAAKVLEETHGDLFSVKAALGHKRSTSTLHYVAQRRQVREAFHRFSSLTGILFDEAQQGYAFDPKVLMARCFNGTDVGITEGQRRALNGPRTRMGMGCADPMDPPKELSSLPGDRGLCSVQRCVLCKHGYFFPDEPGAVDALEERLSELEAFSSSMPLDVFGASSYAVEQATIVALLERSVLKQGDTQ